MIDPLNTLAKQSEIIKMQNDIIDELFILLMQHISTEDIDKLSVKEKIRETTSIYRDL